MVGAGYRAAMPSAEVAPGVEIAYQRVGVGPSLLLVHGITESRHTWDPLVADLAMSFDVIAVDLRGHGESSRVGPFDAVTFAGDLAALARGLGLRRPLLVGHSLGGIVVTALATMIPVRAVLDIDQPLRLSDFQAALAPAAGLIRGSRDEFEGFMAGLFASIDGPLPADERERIATHSRPDQEVVIGIWSGVLDGSAAELDALVDGLAARVSAPYLSLHGTDPGPDYAAWLTSRIPSAVVELWPDQGHYPHLVAPDRFLARVRDLDTETS